MATSISKLAVLITGDTSGLARATADGSRLIKGFNNSLTTPTLTGKGNFAQSLLVGGGFKPLLEMSARGGALALATLALFKFGQAGVEAGRGLADLRMEARLLENDIAQLKGTTVKSTEDMVSGWEKFKRSLGDLSFEKFTRPTGGGLGNLFGELAKGVDVLAATPFSSRFGNTGPSPIAKAREDATKRIEQLKAEKAAAEAAATAERKRQDEWRKNQEDINRRADSLAESLRTPMEVFKDTAADINNLFMQGLVTVENYNRGMKRAADELLMATKRANEFKTAGTVTVSAAERHSMAGFSAVIQGQLREKREAELLKAALDEEKKQTKVITEMKNIIERKPPQVIRTVDLGT